MVEASGRAEELSFLKLSKNVSWKTQFLLKESSARKKKKVLKSSPSYKLTLRHSLRGRFKLTIKTST